MNKIFEIAKTLVAETHTQVFYGGIKNKGHPPLLLFELMKIKNSKMEE